MKFFTLTCNRKIELPADDFYDGIRIMSGVVFPVTLEWTGVDQPTEFGGVPGPHFLISYPTISSEYGYGHISNELLTNTGGGAILVPWQKLLQEAFPETEMGTQLGILVTEASVALWKDGLGVSYYYELVPNCSKDQKAAFVMVNADNDLWDDSEFVSRTDENQDILPLVLGTHCAILSTGQKLTFSLTLPKDRRTTSSDEYCRVVIEYDGEKIWWSVNGEERQSQPPPDKIIA